MCDEELKSWYFDWLGDIVYLNAPFRGVRYDKLITHLNNTPFVYIMTRDANRYDDGISLRNRFAYRNDLDELSRVELLECGKCSVLEMMIAIAMHCEENMEDPYLPDQTSHWFWDMIKSLGLINMTDRSYDEERVDEILDRFMDRNYQPNGKGGLFTIEDCDEDLRNVEIWYQMNWYLCDKYMR